MKLTRIAAALTVVAFCAGPASAAVSIIGGGLGRECYLAAEAGRSERDGVAVCTRALSDEVQSITDRAATFVNRGILRMQAKALDAAIADFDEAIRSRPETAEAYVNKGIAMVHLGNRDRDAVALLTAGIERSPSRPEIAYYVRGIANEQLGDARQAYEDYAKAVALKPGWNEPLEQLERFTVKRRPVAGA